MLEPALGVDASAVVDGAGTTGDAGDTVVYTIDIGHAAVNGPDAFDVTLSDLLPAEIAAPAITAVNAVGIAFLSVFFTGTGGLDFVMLTDLTPHALVNALLAAPVSRGVEVVATSFGDDEGVRRALRLAPRGRSA